MKMGKNRVLRFLLILIPLMLMTGISSAYYWTATDELSFIWKNGDREIPIRLVENFSKNIALYLPGSCDGTCLKVCVPGSQEVTWAGEKLEDGMELDVSAWIGQTVEVTMRDGYKIVPVQVMRGSGIPTLFFDISAEDLKRINSNRKRDIQEETRLLMLDAQGREEASDSLTSCRVHGNSTAFCVKKPYQFKLSHKASLAGMGRGKTWLLLANHFDISLLRNEITYDLCREMGLTGTPDCRQVDVYFNGEYNGTYLLCEKIQLKKDRLDITNMEDELKELNGEEALANAVRKTSTKGNAKYIRYFEGIKEPEDVTGGFLLEIEKALQYTQNKMDGGFLTDHKMCVLIKEPSQPGWEEVNYIAKIVNDFHNAALEKNGISRETGTYYADYIDVASFAAKIAVEEFSCNFDVRAGSQYMYTDSDRVDGKLYAGPGWDYDLTYGNKGDGQTNPLKVDFVYKRSASKVYLYHALLDHEDFRKVTREIVETRLIPAAEILLGRREAPEGSHMRSFAEYSAEISDSAAMNFNRFSTVVGNEITAKAGKNFEDAGAYLLDWITQRTDLINEQWLVEAQ